MDTIFANLVEVGSEILPRYFRNCEIRKCLINQDFIGASLANIHPHVESFHRILCLHLKLLHSAMSW